MAGEAVGSEVVGIVDGGLVVGDTDGDLVGSDVVGDALGDVVGAQVWSQHVLGHDSAKSWLSPQQNAVLPAGVVTYWQIAPGAVLSTAVSHGSVMVGEIVRPEVVGEMVGASVSIAVDVTVGDSVGASVGVGVVGSVQDAELLRS